MATNLRETNLFLGETDDEELIDNTPSPEEKKEKKKKRKGRRQHGPIPEPPDTTQYGEQIWRGQNYVIQDVGTTRSGYLAFGTDLTTVPVTPSTGTGLFIDYSGIHLLNGGVVTGQLLTDGSGYLGSGSVFVWNTTGVLQMNGSAIVENTVSADKVTFSAPTISGLTLTNNSPIAGSVAWSSFTLTYQGTTYTIASGNTTNKYVYWKKAASTTVLQTSATIPSNAPDMFIVCMNLNGTAYQSNFAPFIYADYISVGQLSAISADMGSITAGTVTGATLRTSASNPKVLEDTTGLFGYNAAGNGVFALPVASLSWNGTTIGAGDFAVGTNNDLLYIGQELQLIGLAINRKDDASTGTFDLDPQGYSWVRLIGAGAKVLRSIKKPTSAKGKILYIKNDVANALTIQNMGSAPAGYARISTFGGNYKMPSYGMFVVVYDDANTRWTIASQPIKATATKASNPLAGEGYDDGVTILSALPSTTVRAGTDVLTLSAGTLANDMSIPSSGTWTMEIVTPSDGTTWLFADGDTAYMRNGASEIYFTVTRGANDGDTQTYTCTFANGTRPLSFAAGSGVLNYGASGQGFLYDTVASGLPYSSVRTHTGSPWSPTEHVRLGSLTGITDATFGALSGYGLWTDNVYLTGSINATAGTISGSLTIGGTLRSAASPNARYELSSVGLKTYDSNNVQRVQILNDGSGWLGSSSVLSWTTAGVVSLNGSAVVANSLDADKVSFSAPTVSGLTLTNNSPSAGYVAWSSFKLTYQGVTYTIASGNSNNKYIYWKKSVSTTVLQTSATIPANAADMFVVCVNFSGTAYQTNFAPFIYADYISVNNLQAISAAMGTLTSGTIIGSRVATSDTGARTELHYNNLFGMGFGGIGGYDGSTVQWYAKASDGKIYAGGGNTVVDSDGLSFVQGASSTNAVKWKSSSTVYGKIYNTVGAAAGLYLTNDAGNNAAEGQIGIESNTSGGSGTGQMYINARTLKWYKNGTATGGLAMGLSGTMAAKSSTTTIQNTTTETSCGITATIPGNKAAVGDCIKITAAGFYSTTGTPTMRFRVFLGSTAVANTTSFTPTGTSVSNRGWRMEVYIPIRSVGASGTVFAQGFMTLGRSDIVDFVSTAPTTVNFTTNQAVDLRFTWGAASTSNSLTCTLLQIEYLTPDSTY